MLRTSEATRLAVTTAEANPALAEQLGRPLKTGWLISGNIEVQPGSGHAELAIPIYGPKGSGRLYAEARKQAGLWHLSMLQFGTNGSIERLDLLPASELRPSIRP
jgi:hypothetical protein